MCIRAGAAGRRGAGRAAFPSAASAAASCRGPSLELQRGPEQVVEPDQPDPRFGPEMSIEPGARVHEELRPVAGRDERGVATQVREITRLHHLAGPPVSYTHLRAHETRHDLVCR